MPTTGRGYVTPTGSDDFDIPGDMQILAQGVNDDVDNVEDALTAHEADTTSVHGIPDTAALLEAAGLNGASTVRRGKSIVATDQQRNSTSYGVLGTPDRVQNVVVPTDGLLYIAFEALMKGSVSTNARAAIFIGSNQVRARNDSTGNVVQEALSGNADWQYVSSFSGGLSCSVGQPATATSSVTTGQVIGAAGDQSVQGLADNSPLFGPCLVHVAAGTYDVSVQYKAASGTVNVKERKLWVWTLGF